MDVLRSYFRTRDFQVVSNASLSNNRFNLKQETHITLSAECFTLNRFSLPSLRGIYKDKIISSVSLSKLSFLFQQTTQLLLLSLVTI